MVKKFPKKAVKNRVRNSRESYSMGRCIGLSVVRLSISFATAAMSEKISFVLTEHSGHGSAMPSAMPTPECQSASVFPKL